MVAPAVDGVIPVSSPSKVPNVLDCSTTLPRSTAHNSPREVHPVFSLSRSESLALLSALKGEHDGDLEAQGMEPMTAGFANRVCGVERHGQHLVVKSYSDLVFLRVAPTAVGAVDVLAGEVGLGPKVFYSGSEGLVMRRLPGAILEEKDMHCKDTALLESVARTLAAFHQLAVPEVCKGKPMLWSTIDKMLDVAARKPELLPAGMPPIADLYAEVERARRALQRHNPRIVLGHGDLKPSNVFAAPSAKTGDFKRSRTARKAMLIDFELAGPNYCGFDLMKLFRTAKGFSEESMRHFLGEYAKASNEIAGGGYNAEHLMEEARLFEPLSWLEACVFFLALPQFRPTEAARWKFLALDRWAKYTETKDRPLGTTG